jgi:hypothetical protein
LNDWSNWNPTELAFHMMRLSAKWETPSPFTKAKESEITLFNKHVGSQAWWDHLKEAGENCNIEEFISLWNSELEQFKDKISRYHLY